MRSLSFQQPLLLWCFMFVPCYHLSIFERLISLKREHIYIYVGRERERECVCVCMCIQKHTKNEANQPQFNILYSSISYVIHTSLIHFICLCKFQQSVWLPTQTLQQQGSRKKQIGYPYLLLTKVKNAINTIIKIFTTNCLQPSINTCS